LGARFCAVPDLVGAFFALLSVGGLVFGVGGMHPPLPLCVGCFGLGFSRNCLGFVLESDREGGFSGFLSMDGVVFTGGRMTPPSFFVYERGVFVEVCAGCGRV